MYKTITITQNWSPIEDQSLKDQFDTAINTWIAEGKYTGQDDPVFDSDTKARTVTRWDWADQATAQAFIDLTIQLFNGVQGQVITGEVVQA